MPFSFELCQDTLKCILISESIYSFSYLAYYYNRKNYRRNEEYGSAKWANNKAVNKKYAEKDYYSNKILSQNVRIGLDGRRHRRNLNTFWLLVEVEQGKLAFLVSLICAMQYIFCGS